MLGMFATIKSQSSTTAGNSFPKCCLCCDSGDKSKDNSCTWSGQGKIVISNVEASNVVIINLFRSITLYCRVAVKYFSLA